MFIYKISGQKSHPPLIFYDRIQAEKCFNLARTGTFQFGEIGNFVFCEKGKVYNYFLLSVERTSIYIRKKRRWRGKSGARMGESMLAIKQF